MDLGLEIWKSKCGFGISIIENYVRQFSEKTDNFQFLGLNFAKNGFWSWNFKNVSPDSKLASLKYSVHQFSDKTDKSEFLSLNSAKIWFWGPNFENVSLDLELASLRY